MPAVRQACRKPACGTKRRGKVVGGCARHPAHMTALLRVRHVEPSLGPSVGTTCFAPCSWLCRKAKAKAHTGDREASPAPAPTPASPYRFVCFNATQECALARVALERGRPVPDAVSRCHGAAGAAHVMPCCPSRVPSTTRKASPPAKPHGHRHTSAAASVAFNSMVAIIDVISCRASSMRRGTNGAISRGQCKGRRAGRAVRQTGGNLVLSLARDRAGAGGSAMAPVHLAWCEFR